MVKILVDITDDEQQKLKLYQLKEGLSNQNEAASSIISERLKQVNNIKNIDIQGGPTK